MNKKTLILLAITTIVLTMGAGCATKTATTDDNYGVPYNGAVGPSDPVSEDQVPYNGAVDPSDPVSEDPTAPLSYSISGVSATISKETVPFDYTADQLESMAKECGTPYEESYFDELVATYSGTNKTIYNFKYSGESQESDTFVVTLLPNKLEYSALGQFKKSFDTCAVGGSAYPTKLNADWFLFESACGSGYDDGSGLPHGCDEVKKVVSPTLTLN